MDIISMMKQLKSLETEYEKLKTELASKEHMLERAGITMKFDGLGNIKDFSISEDVASKPIAEFKDDLKSLIEEYQDMVKENLTKAMKDRFLGSLPFGF
ncbi:MAG: hypothetical protein ACP5S8_03405 [Hydrogenobaculum sp.]